MNNNFKLLALTVCIVSLSSCSSIMGENRSFYQDYNYDRTPATQMDRSESYQQQNESQSSPQSSRVSVPNSYHVGQMSSPTSHKSQDKSWVNSQNPMGYTIEVADDVQAASVASKLQQAPSSNRKAQVQYNRSGESHYKGLYGSYNNYQEAKKALDALPEDVKKNAKVSNWGTVQSGVNR